MFSRKFVTLIVIISAFLPQCSCTCDGNPHNWGRVRRCDQTNSDCPNLYSGCTTCEGIGGVATGDEPDQFQPVKCTSVGTASEMKAKGITPAKPAFPDKFVNTGFFEVQIFVKHDPFCLAQIPATVSNGTHCYKAQEGTFNFDGPNNALRIDYQQSRTNFKFNMTEHFHHVDDCVHPEITRYGIDKVPICPCINVSVGPVSAHWAHDAEYVGREILEVEYIGWGSGSLVDHFVKGPHHVWTDVKSGNIIRLWQPFNGLEVFHPEKYSINMTENLRKLPLSCELGAKACIQAFPNKTKHSSRFAALPVRPVA